MVKSKKIVSRDPIFDIMKGIAIIAMIIGHKSIPEIFSSIIYSWHMPLFFIVSGYFYRQKKIISNLKTTSRQLIIPYLIGVLIIVLFAFIGIIFKYNTPIEEIISGIFLPDISKPYGPGALWFLIALFWCKNIYNSIQIVLKDLHYNQFVIFTLIVMASYFTVKYINGDKIPFYLAQAIITMPFFCIGHCIHDIVNEKPSLISSPIQVFTTCVLCSVILVLSIFQGKLDLLYIIIPSYCFNFTGAVAGTILVFYISKFIKNAKLGLLIQRIGYISLLILLIHTIDKYYFLTDKILSFLQIDYNIVNLCLSIIGAITLSILLSKIKIIQKIFNFKDYYVKN